MVTPPPYEQVPAHSGEKSSKQKSPADFICLLLNVLFNLQCGSICRW